MDFPIWQGSGYGLLGTGHKTNLFTVRERWSSGLHNDDCGRGYKKLKRMFTESIWSFVYPSDRAHRLPLQTLWLRYNITILCSFASSGGDSKYLWPLEGFVSYINICRPWSDVAWDIVCPDDFQTGQPLEYSSNPQEILGGSPQVSKEAKYIQLNCGNMRGKRWKNRVLNI